MSKSQPRIIRKRNPGMLQSDEEVRAQFVVREHELAIALETLRGNVAVDSCQHTLIVAPRGRGKTMLLARIAAELRGNSELSDHLLPVRFMEESDEILSAADFWLEVLFYLANAVDKENPGLARNLRATRDDLATRWRERELDERVRVAVLEAACSLGRRLVLMVENLQALCANVDEDFGWNLRKTLQTEPQIILLATATSRFEALDDAGEPFFELFRIIALAPLNAAQCGRLWEVVSGDAASERQQRALEILTGGSPRYVVIVAGFARHRSLRQLMEELAQLVDDLTDTFRGYQEALPRIERRVFLAIADLWQPSSTGEISDHARMDVRTVSTMLGRLVKRHAVRARGSGRRRLYEVAEPLYSIYYQLRRQRDEAAVVQNLLRFMIAFYRNEEIVALSGHLISEASRSIVIRAGIERARMEISQLDHAFNDGAWTDIKQIVVYDRVVERLGSRRDLGSLVQVASAIVRKGRVQGQLGEHRAAIATYDEAIDRFGSSDEIDLQVWVAASLINKGIVQHTTGAYSAATLSYGQVVTQFGSSSAPELQVSVCRALLGSGIACDTQKRHADAIPIYEEVIKRSTTNNTSDVRRIVAFSMIRKAISHEKCGEFHAAIATNDDVVLRFGRSDDPELQSAVARAMFRKSVEQRECHRHAAAMATCDEVVRRFGTSESRNILEMVAAALVNKGEVQRKQALYAAETRTYNEVIERFGDSTIQDLQVLVAQAIFNKGFSESQRGERALATASYDQLLKRFSVYAGPYVRELVAQAMFNKACVHGELGEHEAEVTIYDLVVERFGDCDAPELRRICAGALINKGVVQTQRETRMVAIASFNEVVERLRNSDSTDLRSLVAQAIFLRSLTHITIGKEACALHGCDELETRYGSLLDNRGVPFEWNARWMRMMILIKRGDKSRSDSAFRSLYAAFAPVSDVMTGKLIDCVRLLVSGGSPDQEVLDTLSSDPEKSDALAPLVVALRQRTGEEVRAPVEVLKIAADIRKQIDA